MTRPVGWTIFVSVLLFWPRNVVQADEITEPRLDHYLELRQSDVAQAVGIPESKVEAIQRHFEPLYLQVQESFERYPRGGQDGEGAYYRERERSRVIADWGRSTPQL